MNIANLFVRASRRLRRRGRPWRSARTCSLTHGALVRRAAAIAGALRSRFGLAPGDRVALVMSNVPDYVELLLAGWHAGLTMVPANAKLHRRELAYILGHAGARVCFVTPDLAETVAPLADELRVPRAGRRGRQPRSPGAAPGRAGRAGRGGPDDVAWLFYTSGTTGRPKGAMLTHRNLLAMTLAYLADVDGIAPGDAILHAAPMSHGSGLYILPHAARGACQMLPPGGGFDPAEVIALLQTPRGERRHHPVRGADHGQAARRAPRCRPLRRIPA